MKNTFKKSLVAAAVLAFAGSANAALVVQTVATPTSQQGILANLTAIDVDVVLQAQYAVGDVITFKFPGGTLRTGVTPAISALDATAGLAAANALDSSVTFASVADASGMTFGLLSYSGDTVSYRVTALPTAAAGATNNAVIRLSGVQFTGASVRASRKVDVAFSAQTSNGVALDVSAKNSGKLIEVRDQFELKVTTPADAKIDVNTDRLTFESNALTDSIVFETENKSYLSPATISGNGVTYTVTGDFSWADADLDGSISSTELTNAIGFAGATLSADKQTLTFSHTDGSARTLTLTVPSVNGKALQPIPQTTFAVRSVVTHGTTSSTYNADAGEWKLNGSQVRVPYLVLQDGRFSSIINVTNHGRKAGAITVDVFDENGAVVAANYPAGNSVPGSVVSVAGPVRAALLAAGKDLTQTTKFSVQIVTNVPANDVMVYAAYADSQNGGERAIVNNDSKVQTKN